MGNVGLRPSPLFWKRLMSKLPLGLLFVTVTVLAVLLAHAGVFDFIAWAILLVLGSWRFLTLRTSESDKEKREREEKEARELSSPLDKSRRIEKWFQLKQLEYDKAADRYDNIYQAVWRNFSYMAVLAGGILTFGAKDLDRAVAYCLALTPLAFWFIATFLPMDHYGDETRKRLSMIEDEINQIYFPKPTDPRLQHFRSFKLSKYKWRVQDAVRYFGVTVTAVWTLMAVLAVHHAVKPSSRSQVAPSRQTLQLEPQPFQVEMRDSELAAVRDSLALLSRRVFSTDSLLRCRLLAVGAQGRPACKR